MQIDNHESLIWSSPQVPCPSATMMVCRVVEIKLLDEAPEVTREALHAIVKAGKSGELAERPANKKRLISTLF